jgi:hypothetical protein
MSVSELNFPLEHTSKNGGYASKYDEETRESKFDDARFRERKQEWRGFIMNSLPLPNAIPFIRYWTCNTFTRSSLSSPHGEMAKSNAVGILLQTKLATSEKERKQPNPKRFSKRAYFNYTNFDILLFIC